MSTQHTLTGEEADERTRPNTFIYCEECDAHLLLSDRATHEHDLYAGNITTSVSDYEHDDEEETVEKVGAWYDITLSYSVDYRFRLPACTEHQAESLAKDLRIDATPADRHSVHTRRSKVDDIFEDDSQLPDDFDPFGGESLYDAIQRAEDDG